MISPLKKFGLIALVCAVAITLWKFSASTSQETEQKPAAAEDPGQSLALQERQRDGSLQALKSKAQAISDQSNQKKEMIQAAQQAEEAKTGERVIKTVKLGEEVMLKRDLTNMGTISPLDAVKTWLWEVSRSNFAAADHIFTDTAQLAAPILQYEQITFETKKTEDGRDMVTIKGPRKSPQHSPASLTFFIRNEEGKWKANNLSIGSPLRIEGDRLVPDLDP